MAVYSSALRRALAKTLSSQRHRSLATLITTRPIYPARPPQPGSTPARFRFASTEPENTSASPNKAKKNGDEDEDEGPPIWVNRENIDDDTVLVDGCDFNHWLVIMGFPEDPKPSDDDMIQSYVSTVAKAIGSEEEAKKKIYSVSTGLYTGFGVALSREVAKTLQGQPNVQWVLPDSYIDVPSKDYGGDLYLDGKVVRRPEFQIRQRESHSDLESDFDFPLGDFVYEETEDNDGIYKQLKATMQTTRKDPIVLGINGSEEASVEDTSKLLDKLSARMEAMRKKGKDGETEEDSELNVKRSKIEPYESKNGEETCDSNLLLTEELESESRSDLESTTETHLGMHKLRERLSNLSTEMKENEKGLSGSEEEGEEIEEEASSLMGNTKEDTGLCGSDESEEKESNNVLSSIEVLREGLNSLRNEMIEIEKRKENNLESLTSVVGAESNHPIFDRIKERTRNRLPIEKYSFDDETDTTTEMSTTSTLSSENARDGPKPD